MSSEGHGCVLPQPPQAVASHVSLGRASGTSSTRRAPARDLQSSRRRRAKERDHPAEPCVHERCRILPQRPRSFHANR